MKTIENKSNPETPAGRVEQTSYPDMDRACVERLGQLYRGVAPPERLKAMEKLPTRFVARAEFEREYRTISGQKPSPEVLGCSQGLEAPALVSIESPQLVPEVAMHERVHQLSDPRAAQMLGGQRYEGVTQDLALKALGKTPAAGEVSGYPEQRASAHELRELCGDQAVEKVYFQGEPSELKACLDRALGDGRAEQFRKTMRTPA